MRRLVLLLALLLPALAGAAGFGVDPLMELLANHGGGRVGFVERKFLAILDQPIESTGEMEYSPPARLLRQTLTPRPETMLLEGDSLTLTREGRSMQLRLGDYPQAAVFIESIRSTLAGDRKALERNFLLSLAGERARWSLDLLPSDPALAELVLRIHIEGHEGQIRSIEIHQGDGDRSLMLLEALPAGRRPGKAP